MKKVFWMLFFITTILAFQNCSRSEFATRSMKSEIPFNADKGENIPLNQVGQPTSDQSENLTLIEENRAAAEAAESLIETDEPLNIPLENLSNWEIELDNSPVLDNQTADNQNLIPDATATNCVDKSLFDYIGDFESSKIQSASSKIDGIFLQTLRSISPHSYVGLGDGGASSTDPFDTKVVSSETRDLGNGKRESITPRTGRYFMRSEIDRNKNYTTFTGNDGQDKPRSGISVSNEANRFNFDEEGYIGFSIYTAQNYQHETATLGVPGAIQLLSINPTTQSSFISFSQYATGSTSNKAHWIISLHVNDRSIYDGKEYGTTLINYDLGSVDLDKGKWTDFVIRYRANPFKVTTNPKAAGIPGSTDKSFLGNKGIFEVWKTQRTSTGSSFKKLVSRVNQPVGLVPRPDKKLHHGFRIYKYGWKKNPTSVLQKIYFAFDSIRFGAVKNHPNLNASTAKPQPLCP